jgi:hypothetical protein
MLVSQLSPAHRYPQVQGFIASLLDMQFSDARAMLQLPRPEVGITPGCNFAITSTLYNLLSGISTTIYKPPHLLHEAESAYGAGPAFRDLVRDFFPYTPAGANNFPRELYQLCRNPLAHSVGLVGAEAPVVSFTRIFHASHAGEGWSDQELNDLERPGTPFRLQHPGIVVNGRRWTLHCDSFYLDVIDLLRRLTADATQMAAAEQRFGQGVFNWRQQ